MLSDLLKNNVIVPISRLLKQGLSPKKLVLVFAVGFSFGLFPILGVHAVMCTGVALIFRLNIIAIQVAHSLAFPFQILLFIPFFKFGGMVTSINLEGISEDMVLATFSKGLIYAFQVLSEYLLLACLGWILLIFPIFFTIYFFLMRFVKWFSSNISDQLPNKPNH